MRSSYKGANMIVYGGTKSELYPVGKIKGKNVKYTEI